LVQQVGKSLHLIRDEIARWRTMLEIPYREYLSSIMQLSDTRDLYMLVDRIDEAQLKDTFGLELTD